MKRLIIVCLLLTGCGYNGWNQPNIIFPAHWYPVGVDAPPTTIDRTFIRGVGTAGRMCYT